MKILYGIQPTGKIHIGNYLGGLKKSIELQKDHEVIFLVAGIHSLTTNPDYDAMMRREDEMVSELRKLGARNIIRQSERTMITDIMWEVMCYTNYADLLKMTQFKDKKGDKGNAGLFTYPVLMCADIIYFNPDYVLVGEDQLQHLELYRKVAKKMNLPIAKPMMTETPRIMSIKDPTKKMSKSLGDEHCLYLFEDNTKKIMKAPTTPEGIKNLKIIAKGLGVRYGKNYKNFKQRIINKMQIKNNSK